MFYNECINVLFVHEDNVHNAVETVILAISWDVPKYSTPQKAKLRLFVSLWDLVLRVSCPQWSMCCFVGQEYVLTIEWNWYRNKINIESTQKLQNNGIKLNTDILFDGIFEQLPWLSTILTRPDKQTHFLIVKLVLLTYNLQISNMGL